MGTENAVVPGELGQPGTIDEPQQCQDTLLEDAQGPRALAGAEPFAVLAQESGESLGGIPGEVECCGVGDTWSTREASRFRNVIFADLLLPGLLAYLMRDQARLTSSVRKIADLSDGRHTLNLVRANWESHDK